MERIASIVLLVACIAGLGYFYMEEIDRTIAEQAAQAEMAILAATQAKTDSIEASKAHFTIPHDKDANTTSMVVLLDGSGSSDAEGDSLAYSWSLIDGNAELNSDSMDVTTFSASAGEYTLKLTVTDNYGASTSNEKTVSVTEEPNTAPDAQIIATELKED